MKQVIIIGAGILGASTAYHLAKDGVSVTVVDRNEKGQATKAGAGIVCPWLTNRSNKAWYQLVLQGARYYPGLIEALEADGEKETGYRRVGAINIFDTDEKLAKKYDLAWKRREEAPEMGDITKLSPSETKEMFPVLDDSYRALHISGGARVNGGALNRALLNAARRYGANVIHGDASLYEENQTVKGVRVKDQVLPCDEVVVANGAWSKELFQQVGIKVKTTFEKAQIVHVSLPQYNTEEWPVLLPPYGHYQLGFDGGRVVIGATKEKGTGFDTRVTAGAIHELFEKALTVSPGLREATYLETKVGFRPFTKGSIPAIGRIPEHPNVILANGLGASGLTSGPFIGSEVSKIVQGIEPIIRLEDFSVDRVF
ncbi:NAD(P)/FAD-dependent oxidoreductase [Halobacillus salinus]|uniref:FAD-binding oxidoreductase n=1 Tax=Halobacillus salinus TaxID=192814 RepID=A0A4Z0H236_9BACI|nr:FAD-dependent oxidoreductase [Halobacillus salinus]TGB04453.1 FAD-binding oxidoreductase [Halobacillus salinus]